jgi:haloalkane dehalogenase
MKDTSWIDRNEYPFESKFIQLDMGRMHYIDEGEGEPIVMLHGNPTWSFLYRHLVKGLSPIYRCVAVDYIGFGLSDKPPTWSYLPEDHAKNVEDLIEKLDLKDITLVVQDWGGPIGLSYALDHPGNVKRLVIMNTWAWPVSDDVHFRRFSRFLGGRLGKLLITRFKFFEKTIMRKLAKNKERFTKQVHKHYIKQFSSHNDRKGIWIFPKEIIGSTKWFDSLWSKKERIKDIPALLVWGMRDMAFREKELQTWEDLFSRSKTAKLKGVGHYVQEEAGPDLIPIITKFLKKIK